jgi:hypothetical protein
MNEFGHELRFGLRDEQELSRIVQRLADMPLFVTRPGECLFAGDRTRELLTGRPTVRPLRSLR